MQGKENMQTHTPCANVFPHPLGRRSPASSFSRFQEYYKLHIQHPTSDLPSIRRHSHWENGDLPFIRRLGHCVRAAIHDAISQDRTPRVVGRFFPIRTLHTLPTRHRQMMTEWTPVGYATQFTIHGLQYGKLSSINGSKSCSFIRHSHVHPKQS